MKHVTLLVLAAVALAACDTSPTAPAANRERLSLSAVTSQTNTVIPIDLFVFVPCANGGAGEVIGVSGPLHFLFQVTISNTGNVLVEAYLAGAGTAKGRPGLSTRQSDCRTVGRKLRSSPDSRSDRPTVRQSDHQGG